MASKNHSKNNHEIVAAIDFGTTYSGYAYSYLKEPDRVFLNTNWPSGSRQGKEPTAILFDDEFQFVTYGDAAVNRYSEEAEEGDQQKYYLFKNFKMCLYNEKGASCIVYRNLMLTAANGKKMKAIVVFSSAIQFFKDHLVKSLNDRNSGNHMKVELIRWVLTVPAIWSNSAKQFMREAAEKAGIPKDNLVIALEPECASLYCRDLPNDKLTTRSSSLELFRRIGTRYLILDNGGGTIDSTIHEISDNDNVREVYKATGGAWGGTKVDQLFMEYLAAVFSDEIIETMRMENSSEWLKIIQRLEQYKRTIDIENSNEFRLLAEPFREICQQLYGMDLVNAYGNKMRDKGITMSGKRLKIEKHVVADMIEQVSKDICSHAQFMMQQTEQLDFIMMVGGFSNSPIVVDAVKKVAAGRRSPVIVPEEAELAILRGAVQYGWRPDTIKVRRSRSTYGIDDRPYFIDGVHPPRLMYHNKDGHKRCFGVFDTLVTVNQEISVGHKVKRTYTPGYHDLKEMTIKLYDSAKDDVKYCDEAGVTSVGKLKVLMPDITNGLERKVIVEVEFGDTEIILNAHEETTGTIYKTSFDFFTGNQCL